ncbi:unnamed protein product [Musa banksii]
MKSNILNLIPITHVYCEATVFLLLAVVLHCWLWCIDDLFNYFLFFLSMTCFSSLMLNFILHFSLGGFAALMTAAESAQHVRGVVLLNSAGQFENPSEQPKSNEEETVLQKFVFKTLKEFIQRIILGFLFWQAKQPARVEKVYINASNVDNYLVESITKPAEDPNAGEVYYRLMTRFMSNQSKYTLNSVLSKLSCPLLLICGDLDPWVGPAKAARIKEFYPNTTIVNLQAGHCPHDEVPELVNEALLNWLSSL